MTVGCCLATTNERKAAISAALRGNWRPAKLLPGSHLTVLDIGRELRVFGDGAGVVPVYWVEHEGAVWWATSATALAALTNAVVDAAWLLGDLTVSGVDFRLHSAPFAGVRRVPPGSALVLRRDAAPTVAPLTPSARASFVPSAQRVREAVTTAVTRRARRYEQVTADLSGGVDSSTVTCLAVTERRPLTAVTYTDARMEKDDDLTYARRIAAEVEGIDHHVIDARESAVRHFDGLQDPTALPATDLPSMSLGLLSILTARLSPLAARGTQAHLTGRGGDNVLAAPSSHRVDAFLAGHRVKAFRLAGDFARVSRIEPWRAWRQLAASAATSYPRALERLASRVAQPLPTVWRPPAVDALAWCGPTAGARWLTLAGRTAVAELVGARATSPVAAGGPGALHDRLDLEWMAAEHATFDAIARQLWGIPVHAPFLDTAVTEAAMAIEPFDRARPGVYKPLARAAFAGLVPHWLLTRQTKTLFTSSVFDGLAANAPALRRLVAGSRLADLGLLDRSRISADLESGIAGGTPPLGALHALLVTELWLARLETAARFTAWWQPAPDRSLQP